MSESVISTVEEYRLLIDSDLLELIQKAIELEKEYINSEEYSVHRQNLEDRLYDLYQEVGWSVVYEFKDLPF